MPRTIQRLSPRRVSTATKPGYYADGGGLYLQVSAARTKSWLFRFTLNGRAREMGLGSLDTFSLADARIRALACRKQLDERIDPIDARDALRAQGKLDAAKMLTFSECTEKYIASHRAGWRNAKHASQWKNSLKTYAEPTLGTLPVQRIEVAHVMKVLDPIWKEKTETATRVRGRIEAILDWATARGLRFGDNPARWRGHLESLLPPPAKVRTVTHHPALPYTEIGAFVLSLRGQEGVAARALEFTILNAARTGEVIGAQLSEFDLDAKIWTIPAERMKTGREHRVPLAARSLAILKAMEAEKTSEYVFPGGRAKSPLSNMALLALLERMGRDDITTHGFRSTFRDWAAESTNFPRDVAEMALAHAVGDKVEAAYRRGELMDKRRKLMEAWAKHCSMASSDEQKVVPMRSRRSA